MYISKPFQSVVNMSSFILSFWFEVALMHFPYTAAFINRNQRNELTFKQVAYMEKIDK